jgi:hypothetical protein
MLNKTRMKLVYIIFVIFLTNFAKAQVNLYGQCGGIGYIGNKACVTGTVCTIINEWFYQCLLGTSNTANVISLYGQCGGIGYLGPTKCISAAACVYLNPWYSQCQLLSSLSTSTSRQGTTTGKTLTSFYTTMKSSTSTSTRSSSSTIIPTQTSTSTKSTTSATSKTTTTSVIINTTVKTTASTIARPSSPSSLSILTSSSFPILTTGIDNQYFTARNGQLYDANGVEFLIRGINSPHLW